MGADPVASPGGFAGRIVGWFLDGRLAPLLLAFSLLIGTAALLTTSREEEPQIVVPLADVFVDAPALDAEEVEKLVATPLERILWQIDGVEHVYSMSRRGQAVVTVRFEVGTDRDAAFARLRSRVGAHGDAVPSGVTGWIVKPVEIDDVAVLAVTLAAPDRDPEDLRRVGEEVLARLAATEDVSRTELIGGGRREVVVEPDAAAMSARGVTLDGLRRAVARSATETGAGAFERSGRSVAVLVGARPASAAELGRTVVAVHAGAPVWLSEVARVADGPAEVRDLVRLGAGPALDEHPLEVIVPLPPGGRDLAGCPAVTLTLAKKRGTNAVTVARALKARLRELVDLGVVPADIGVLVTRDLGRTADRKVDGLVEALVVAVLSVVGLVALALGWKAGFIVAAAVPVTFALTLAVNQLCGYTINRVTLFALILSLGLVVDDPIVDVENIVRHLGRPGRSRRQAVLDAVNEVRPPIILATLAVIVSFLPMFFITGMMGPYMAPMALNVPLAMLSSLIVAFTITPWMGLGLLRAGGHGPAAGGSEGGGGFLRRYRAALGTLLDRRARGNALFFGTVLLLAASLLFPALGLVPLKMLPFDDKDEFQVLLDLPEGASLAAADETARRFEARLRRVPDVTAVTAHVGVPGPLDFNGLVRHAYLRRSPHLADLRVNLAARDRREQSTHALVLGLREELEDLARETGCALKVLETPPGPPVVATVTVEVRGRPDTPLAAIEAAASGLAARLGRERGVVDVDTSVEERAPRLRVRIRDLKAAVHGIGEDTAGAVIAAAEEGALLGTLRDPDSRSPVPVVVRLARETRSGAADLGAIPVAGTGAVPVRLSEIADFVTEPGSATIHHKDLERVAYVFAETAGRAPAEVVLAVEGDPAAAPPPGIAFEWAGEGEWQITLDVFRDLGLAFGAALLLIWILLVGELRSFGLPLVVMSSIPLTMIGIFPGFALLNAFADRDLGGYGDPVFFTATAMIGMIALAGIVVRNSITLVHFAKEQAAAGRPLRDAVLDAGIVRLRPVLLTAATAIAGAWPITLDPIFSGLAWALIFGLVASTAFTLVVVPVACFRIFGRRSEAAAGAKYGSAPGPGAPAR